MSPCEEVAEPGLELVSVWLWRCLFSSLWHFAALMLWDLRLKSLKSAVSCQCDRAWGVTGDAWDNVHSALLGVSVIANKCGCGAACPLRRCVLWAPITGCTPGITRRQCPHVRRVASAPCWGSDHTQTGQMCVSVWVSDSRSPASRWTGGGCTDTHTMTGGRMGGQASWESADLSGRASPEGTLVPGLRCEGPVRQESGCVGSPPLPTWIQTPVHPVELTRPWVKAEPVLKPAHGKPTCLPLSLLNGAI